MKAISLWQPWASLWASGRKGFETRHWAPSHRGEFLVHAARKICIDDIPDELRQICEDEFGGHWAVDIPRGALIATANLVRCFPTGSLLDLGLISDEELAQGNFEPGRFGWKAENMKLLDRPIPWRGRQSLFDVPDRIITGAPAPEDLQGKLL